MTLIQSCWRNEGSLNRGLDRCRGLGLDGPFFSDSCSKLEIDEVFQISHKLGLGLAAKFFKAFAIQLDRFRGQYTPRPTAHPPKKARFVCWPHICSTSVRAERSSHPLSPSAPPPSSPPHPPPPLPPRPLSPHPLPPTFPPSSPHPPSSPLPQLQ